MVVNSSLNWSGLDKLRHRQLKLHVIARPVLSTLFFFLAFSLVRDFVTCPVFLSSSCWIAEKEK